MTYSANAIFQALGKDEVDKVPVKCRSCRRRVIANIDGFCGKCSVRREFSYRRRRLKRVS
jgi:hypothetical protein